MTQLVAVAFGKVFRVTHLRGVKGEVKVMAGDPVEAVFARIVGASRIIPNVTVRTVILRTICLVVNYYIQSLLPTVNGF